MQRMLVTTMLAAGCAWGMPVLADPPDGYYDTITGTDGMALSAQLNTLLNNASVRTYGEARFLLQNIDEDPNDFSRLITVYTATSLTAAWDSGVTWNREHTWPRSLGVGSDGADYSDLHNLHPCVPSINSDRGNLKFGTFPGQWDPNRFGQMYRGRMARMAFYMKTRYPYLSIADLGLQSQFLDWHYDEMPGDTENIRNDGVYDAQQNRNAFADHPEWVWAIFGDAPSDAQITIAGQTPTDGATSAQIDLGPVIGDASLLPAHELMLDKTGSAPTTYSIEVTGDADSVSRYQFGFARNTRSASHDIIMTGTATGPIEATLTIDQTEVTSASAGLGSADGDDVLTLSATVLDHAAPSFDETSDIDLIQFDNVMATLGDPPVVLAIEIHNLAPAPFSAALDIDGVTIIGDTDIFSTNIVPTQGIEPGAFAAFEIEFDPIAAGTETAVIQIEVSDEDLPGAGDAEFLEVHIAALVETDCLADVNGDGQVSPTDFNAWINAFNNNLPACDQNGDGSCTPTDFNAWIANFNTGC